MNTTRIRNLLGDKAQEIVCSLLSDGEFSFSYFFRSCSFPPGPPIVATRHNRMTGPLAKLHLDVFSSVNRVAALECRSR